MCGWDLFFGTLGINAGYHRLLTHRSFECPTWVEHTLALLGACSMQFAPARWVALHRVHHKYSDEEQDPHTPLAGFLWAHFEWIVTNWPVSYDKYAPDMMRDRLYVALQNNVLYLCLYIAHALGFFACGFAAGWLVPSGSVLGGLQLAASFVVWGVFVRTVWVWHGTWAINSLSHLSGYRNYNTADQSRNNWLVALLNTGEGWHNNHHADPNCAAAGHRWWELDVTYWAICLMGLLGLASDIVPVRGHAGRVYGAASPSPAVVYPEGTRVEVVQSHANRESEQAEAPAPSSPQRKRAA